VCSVIHFSDVKFHWIADETVAVIDDDASFTCVAVETLTKPVAEP